MKSLNTFVILSTLVVLSGCGSGMTWVESDPMQVSPKPDRFVMPVLKEAPTRPHKILGELSVTMPIKPSFRETSTYDQAMAKLMREARKRGADAIVQFKTLDSQKKEGQGRLTLMGKLVIYTAPKPLPPPEHAAGSR